jgi:dUTP pyrophosphatase
MSSTPPPRTEIDDISSTKRLPSSPEAAKSESKRVKTDMTDATTTIVDAASNMATKTTTTSPITNPSGLAALQIKKLSPAAKTPTRGSEFAAGYDMYAVRATTIPARGKALVDTDIAMAVPAGTYGRIAPRSGLAAKNFIDTGAGVIDADVGPRS